MTALAAEMMGAPRSQIDVLKSRLGLDYLEKRIQILELAAKLPTTKMSSELLDRVRQHTQTILSEAGNLRDITGVGLRARPAANESYAVIQQAVSSIDLLLRVAGK